MNVSRFVRFVKDYLNPKQKWLFRKIGNHFVDKDFIIETTLFESLIHFWENEKGGESLKFQFSSDDSWLTECRETFKRVYDDLLECYEYAKSRESIWEEFWKNTNPIAEEKLIEKETHYLMTIIEHRKFMWT